MAAKLKETLEEKEKEKSGAKEPKSELQDAKDLQITCTDYVAQIKRYQHNKDQLEQSLEAAKAQK